MEQTRHIKETQNKELLRAQTGVGETSPVRDKINQADVYDPATETRPEQIAVREVLNSIDENVLKEIFSEYFRKSGSDEETMNWVPLADVRIIFKSPEEEKVSRSPYGAQSIAEGVQLFSHRLWHDPELTLWTLIHEEAHSLSQDKVRLIERIDDRGELVGDSWRVKSGVAVSGADLPERTDEGKKEEPTYQHFDERVNEGITELLTERIFREYKKRTGSKQYSMHPTQPEQRMDKTDEYVARAKFDSYQRYWQNARLYIGIISALTDVPEDVVENSVIRTYLRNGTILPYCDPEAEAMLSAVYPKLSTILFNLLNSTKEASPSLNAYIDHLNRQNIPEPIKQKLTAALYKLREEWGEAYKIAPYQM